MRCTTAAATLPPPPPSTSLPKLHLPRRSLLFLSTTTALSLPPLSSSASPPPDTTITDRVFMDFALCPSYFQTRTLGSDLALCPDSEPVGRVVLGLYGNLVPITVSNFKSMCTGAAGYYKGTLIQKIFPGRFFMAGRQGRRDKGEVKPPVNLVRNTESVDPKAFQLGHTKGGVLSLCLSENDDDDDIKFDPDYHNVEFMITTGPGPCPDLDGGNIVFGSVLEDEESREKSTRTSIYRDRRASHDRLIELYFADEPRFHEGIFSDRFRMSKRLFNRILHDIESNFEWFTTRFDGRGRPSFTALQKCTVAIRRGDHPKPTVILEAVASQEMWFWHAFFGVAGSNNDINVLNQSTLFTDELKGIAPKAPFIVNGREYKRGYYLADGIYPTWSTFVKAYTHPYAIKEKKMKKVQEAARKDVERAFRRLKAKWRIVDRKARPTDTALMENIMYACMILHNMTLKDEGVAISPVHIRDPPVPPTDTENVYMEIRDSETHFQLRFDITEHIANNLEVVLTEEELNANPPPP